MKALVTATLLAAFAALSTPAFANVPSLMSYQGRVSDASGALIAATTPVNRTVTFKFYSASTGGTPLYAEAQTVTISAGEFSVLLGNGTGVSTFKGPSAPALTPYITLSSIMTGTVYLGVTVDDGTSAADVEIAPRQQIVSAAFAFRAQVAEGLLDGSLSTTMLANTSVTTDKLGGASVTNAKLATDAVNTSNIISGSINESRLANNAVTSAKIADGAVASADIADTTIVTADLADASVTSAKIADGAITSIDIGDGQVGTVDLANLAVSNAKIADGAIDYNKLAAAIQQSLVPVGTIIAFAGDTAPAGWLLCNGQTVSRTTYSTLYQSIVGNRFGQGDNSTTFNVPDLRGRFLRGRDGGATRDEDRASRSAMNTGGATGDAVGSVQGDSLASHSHPYNDIFYSESGGTVSVTSNKGSGDSDSDNSGWQISRTTSNTGGTETRPENANVNFIIKY